WNSGWGVDKSLPRKRENSKNSFVTSTQTVCEPVSASLVLQQPSRKKPVTGVSLQPCNASPNTLTDGLMTSSTGLLIESARSELRAVGGDHAERIAAVA